MSLNDTLSSAVAPEDTSTPDMAALIMSSTILLLACCYLCCCLGCICAWSHGVPESYRPQLESIIQDLEKQGYLPRLGDDDDRGTRDAARAPADACSQGQQNPELEDLPHLEVLEPARTRSPVSRKVPVAVPIPPMLVSASRTAGSGRETDL
eukprot:TRINITY_DN96029_c0_g1_i1.p1 TRINITY_DN96029_c0_g1~~TRINITY_DN96029_c0_g1_i1.p1  ORF type:complete len:152 (+),score=24.77 TRINITY_DN96029_c0_g1_i1:94-549(+)